MATDWKVQDYIDAIRRSYKKWDDDAHGVIPKSNEEIGYNDYASTQAQFSDYENIAEERRGIAKTMLDYLYKQKGFGKDTQNFTFKDQDGDITMVVRGKPYGPNFSNLGNNNVIVYKFPQKEGRWVKVDGGKWNKYQLDDYISEHRQKDAPVFDIYKGTIRNTNSRANEWTMNNPTAEGIWLDNPNYYDKSVPLEELYSIVSGNYGGKKSQEQQGYEALVTSIPDYARLRAEAGNSLRGDPDFFQANNKTQVKKKPQYYPTLNDFFQNYRKARSIGW